MALFLGWSAVVVAALVLLARPWSQPTGRALLPWLIAAAVAGLELWNGKLVYDDLIGQGSWTAATMTIAVVPMKAIIVAGAFYAAVYLFNAARASAETGVKKFGATAAVAALAVSMAAFDLVTSIDAGRVRAAASSALSPADVDALTARVQAGEASNGEVIAFLENPLCPSDLLAEYANNEQRARIAVARNPAVPLPLLVRLSNDEDAEVRLFAMYNKALPAEDVARLSADADARIREAATWKAELPNTDFARLSADTEPRVRAAAALQPRMADDVLKALVNDPDIGVRNTAERKARERGLLN